MAVFRIYVEKKKAFAIEAAHMQSDIENVLQIKTNNIRILNRYDIEEMEEQTFKHCVQSIFAEPPIDQVYTVLPAQQGTVLAIEYLPGQFDQRADSAAQCIQMLTQEDRPTVKSAKIILFEEKLSEENFTSIKHYLINEVEAREASLALPKTLQIEFELPVAVKSIEGFCHFDEQELRNLVLKDGLAMDLADLQICQQYFQREKREPTMTELKVLDTYWSDHCRHTTFNTELVEIKIADPVINNTYERYLRLRENYYGNKQKPVTLMDIATIGAKSLKKAGILKDLDESEEINACSVKIKVDVNGKDEKYLFMFKNETHNHPTEVEPFGGAATCLGGAIRDPLSGRSYVYQAMRITGAGDPLEKSNTIPGKLSQQKITTTAAAGFSSYGNQIGVATGFVEEVYHPGYIAKRMEVGAVLGAAPVENVVRETPLAGDVVILLGGKTGRDGCGGATGSSKAHTKESLRSCGAEVQKGNPPEERKIQRFFRNPLVTKKIKRCNDFGAGGVAVAVGELADSLTINLDAIPKKYLGLDGTELAISESQERMAIIVSKENAEYIITEAYRENLEATVIAQITDENRLKMVWQNQRVVNLERTFLNSNGARREAKTEILNHSFSWKQWPLPNGDSLNEKWGNHLQDLNICSQRGLAERFDATIGAGSVMMPFGGREQLTPAQSMVAKIPVLQGETSTCSVFAYGFSPVLASISSYHSAYYAVVDSVAKVIACGGSMKKCWLSLQEYFAKANDNPIRWGSPLAALLGALEAQLALEVAAIGGKDSMSGTYEDISVPPTLISFAASISKTENIVSPEFKKVNSKLIWLKPVYLSNGLIDAQSLKRVFATIEKMREEKTALAIYAVSKGGVAEAISKMAFGNKIGFNFAKEMTEEELFRPFFGSFLIEVASDNTLATDLLGKTQAEYTITGLSEIVDLTKIQALWQAKLEPVFPTIEEKTNEIISSFVYTTKLVKKAKREFAIPKVLIPVFPGTNCEYDTARACRLAGADVEIVVIKNYDKQAIKDSLAEVVAKVKKTQIIALPGGFSGGDEPDGSAKFITAFFRNPRLTEAVMEHLQENDGLICGICNGFQALIKLGLVPYGEIRAQDENSPTLTFNTIGRHQSGLIHTRIASNKSPWLSNYKVGDIHTIAISHGEGRFIASNEIIEKLAANGQIATQYVDLSEQPTMSLPWNPNGSTQAIEGLLSPDGRVFGKMAHSERWGEKLYLNVAGNKKQNIFLGAVNYFK